MIEFIDDSTPHEYMTFMKSALFECEVHYTNILADLENTSTVGIGFEQCNDGTLMCILTPNSMNMVISKQWDRVDHWYYTEVDITSVKIYSHLALHIDHPIVQSYILELKMRSL